MMGSESSRGPSDSATAILREQLRGHASILGAAVLGSATLGVIMVTALRGREAAGAISLWVALLAVGLVVRIGGGLWYRSQKEAIRSDEDLRSWLLRFRVAFLIHGVVWGAASWLLFPKDDLPGQMILAFAVTTIALGSMGISSFDIAAAALFALPALVPLVARMLLEGGEVHIFISLLIALFLGYVRVSTVHAHGNVRDNAVLRAAEEAHTTERREKEIAERQRLEQTSRFQTALLAARDYEGEDLEGFYRLVTEVSSRALQVERASVWLFDAEHEHLICQDLFMQTRAVHESGVSFARADYPSYFKALYERNALLADDINTHPATVELAKTYGPERSLTSVLTAPLRRGDQLVGEFSFGHTGPPRRWSAEEERFATSMAATVLLALENKGRRRAEASMVDQKEFLEALHQTALDLLARHDLDDLLQAIVERATLLLEAPLGELALMSEGALVIRAYTHNLPYVQGMRMGRAEAPLSWKVYESQEPLVIADYRDWPHGPNMYDPLGLRAVGEFPIVLDDQCLGVLSVARTEPGKPFTAEEVSRGLMLAQHAALVLHNARIYADAVREADDRTRALRESEERFHAVFDHSPVIIALLSVPEGRIVEINAATVTAFGYSREEVVGRTSVELGIWVKAEDREHYLDRLRADGHVAGHEVLMRRKDGSVFPALYFGSLIQIGGKHFSLNTVQDITLRKRAEESLSELNAGLEGKVRERTAELEHARRLAEHANEAKSQFLANMSHEIRTPLNGVLGMIDLLRQTTLRGPQAQMADLAHESAQSLLTIIEDVLDFSKIEAGMVEVEHAPMSIGAAVEKVCELLDPVALKKDVVVTMFTDPALPDPVLGDAVRVRQVLHNIVGNAIKFSSDRVLPRRVSVRALLAEDRGDSLVAEIEISDNGIGMDPAAVSRLFNSFTQADASITRRFGGTGLGLSISRNLTRLMGGEIGVESAPGSGSTFKVRLPFSKATADRSNEAAEALVALDGFTGGIICGDPRFAQDLATYLRDRGAAVVTENEAGEARTALAAHRGAPSVMIVDEPTKPAATREALAGAAVDGGHPPILVIQRGRRRRPRLLGPHRVGVDANVLTRRSFLSAVALTQEKAHAGAPAHQDTGAIPAIPPVRPASRKSVVVLVAEDNKVNQVVIQHQLRALGYAADVVSDGKEALSRWQAGNYALLITDLQMPEMDGYELSAAIRAIEREKGRAPLPIVALTANALKDEALRCQAAGMDDYLAKPAGLADVKTVLERWLPVEPITEGPN